MSERTLSKATHCAFRLSRLPRTIAVLFCLMFAATAVIGSTSQQTVDTANSVSTEDTLSPETERNLIAADWVGLGRAFAANLETPYEACLWSPVPRLLAAHAFLGTNRNNDATILFACACDTVGSKALAVWETWCDQLASQNPTAAVAHYLRGDALARNGKLLEALNSLDRSLGLDPNFLLARNSRGVVAWILGVSDPQYATLRDTAIVDFQLAGQGFDPLADPWVNLGVADLYVGFSPTSAKSNFENALSIDKDFALALNGRSCALAAAGRPSAAARDIVVADSLCRGLPHVKANASEMSRLPDPNSALERIAKQEAISTEKGSFSFGINFGPAPSLYVGYNTPEINIGSFNLGGVYVLLKDGENFIADESGKVRAVGTWFALNYPRPVLP